MPRLRRVTGPGLVVLLSFGLLFLGVAACSGTEQGPGMAPDGAADRPAVGSRDGEPEGDIPGGDQGEPDGRPGDATSGPGDTGSPGDAAGADTAPPPADGGPPASAYAAAVMADGPVGYWRLGEAAGTEAVDEIGNAHPGTYFGGVQLGAPGITADDTAATFDGTSGCIGVGPVFRFAGRVPFSVEGWVKISSYGAEGTRIVSTEGFPTGIRSGWNLSASYGDTGYPYFDAWNSEGTPNQYSMGAYSSVSPGDGLLPLDQWNHVVGTYADDAEELWVNGVRRDRQNQSTLPLPDQGTLSIGCASDGSGPVYLGTHGSLDEIAIYDKVLSEEQITRHYEMGRPR